MAAQAGRDVTLTKNAIVLAGMRSLGFTFNSEPIDISDADDSGLRVLMAAAAGTESLDMPFEGIVKDAVIRTIGLGGGDKLLTDLVLNLADGATLTGDFYLNSYSETGEHKGEVTFTASFLSSGSWVYA